MPNIRPVQRLQRGITLIEVLLVLAIAAAMAAAAYRAFAVARSDALLSDLQAGSIQMAGRVKQVFGAAGTYQDLTPTLLEQAGAVPSQFRFDGESLNDPFGNPVKLSGGRASFAFSYENLSRDHCLSLAPALNSIAYRITVGSDADTLEGQATGRHEYRNARAELDTPSLIRECSQDRGTQRRLAVEIR